ncbi:MAG TPA: hypothetical protein VNM16_01920 [Bacillota bacterium]|nr:hypothetical protein [Bacillota bacterium]
MIPLLIIVAGGLLIGVLTRRAPRQGPAPILAGLTLALAIWAGGTLLPWALLVGVAAGGLFWYVTKRPR